MFIKAIVLFLLISTISLFGQLSYTSSSQISISLNDGLSINKIGGDLDFGTVIYSGNRQTLTRSTNSGVEFEVTGYRNNIVSVSFSRTINLDNYDWANTNGETKGIIRFIPVVEHTKGNINYIGASRVRRGKSYRLSNEIPYGKLYLWVGGSLKLNRNQPYGEYKGQFIITIAY